MVVLSLIDALPGAHPAISSFADRIGQAFLITIGVLLGVEWKVSKD
jgi:hypothetical protein